MIGDDGEYGLMTLIILLGEANISVAVRFGILAKNGVNEMNTGNVAIVLWSEGMDANDDEYLLGTWR